MGQLFGGGPLVAGEGDGAVVKGDGLAHLFNIAQLGVFANVGRHTAGADGVDAHAMGRQFQRHHLGKGHLGCFGARVGSSAGIAKDARAVDRREYHNRAPRFF